MAEQLRTQRAALADFGLFAFKCRDLDELLHRAAELVSDALDVNLVKVLEHRPERHDFLLRSGVNWQPGVVGHVTFEDHAHSPGGYALQMDEPVISRDVATENRFEIPEVLVRHGVKSMVNVIIAGENEPYGVLEVDAQELRDFDDDDISFLRTYANLLAAVIDRARRDEEIERIAREQSVLARELGHRVRNVLGLVQALITQTATGDRSVKQYRGVLMARIRALAAAESLVFQERGDTADPRRIAEEILQPYRADGAAAFEVDGAEARLNARKGRMFGLALHELATNALKYGALSAPEGRVTLRWRVEGNGDGLRIVLSWEEADGPEVSPPERKGFGSRLLEDVVSHELGGSAKLDFRRTGLVYRLSFPAE
jgi:two-component sensor histidine kinase